MLPKLLAPHPALDAQVLSSLGQTLAELHALAPPPGAERDIRCGFPVCNTGELLGPEALATLTGVAEHPFVPFLSELLSDEKEVARRTLRTVGSEHRFRELCALCSRSSTPSPPDSAGEGDYYPLNACARSVLRRLQSVSNTPCTPGSCQY